MKRVIIAAVSDNGVIGTENSLAWKIPADEQFLKEQIQGAAILTGRTSFESAQGSALYACDPKVIILTHQKDYQAPPAVVVHSLTEAFAEAEKLDSDKLAILGGGKVYEQTINQADELIITEIHGNFSGDTHFPAIDPMIWLETRREDHAADTTNSIPYSFVYYQRR